MKKIAIIVAGGTGQRMNSSIPKQFLLILNKPILFHTLRAFKKADNSIELIVVLPANQIENWLALCKQHPEIDSETPHRIIAGGETRFHSSLNGIESIDVHEAMVAIHDGVRPLIQSTRINEAFASAEKYENAVLAVSSKDSVRSWDEASQRFKIIDRASIRLIQTPQIFKLSALKAAFHHGYDPHYTDDASVIEANGGQIHLVDGDDGNIKITTPQDLIVAEAYLQQNQCKI